MRMVVLVGIAMILFGCSNSRELVESETEGGVTVAVALEGGEVTSRATTYSDLCVSLFKESGESIMDTVVDLSGAMQFVSIPQITEGVNYTAIIWTEDDGGDTIHSPVTEQFDVVASEKTTITCELKARCGSILFQLIDLPTVVDSLFLSFVSDSGTFEVSEKRSPKTYLSLDKVPYGATGDLSFKITRDGGSTISDWDTTFTFSREHFAVSFSLINNGTIITEITIEKPGTSTFSALGDTTMALSSESGELVITEFCATGGSGSGEFIELYNPHDVDFTAAELSVKDSKKFHVFTDVTIAAGEYFVIATENGSFWNPDAIAPIDFSSSSGFISLSSDEEIIDYLIYFNDTEAGWEKISTSAKTSWALDDNKLSAESNNSGSNWGATSTAIINGEDEWSGTAGISGK